VAERKTTESIPALGALALAVVRVSSRLPLPAARGLGAALGRLATWVPNQFKRVTRYNLSWCFPELSRPDRERMMRASLLHTGVSALEFTPLLRLPPDRFGRLVAEIEGEELLARALARSEPRTLLLAPHLGNWELLNPFLVRRTPLVALYRPPRIVEMARIISEPREGTGCRMVPATPAGLRQLYQAMGAGAAVAVLPDQEPVRRGGVFAPFFGVPALTMTLVARLVRRFHPSCLLAVNLRRPDGRFSIHFREAPEGLDDPDPVVAATQLNLGIEQCARERPEQYLWSYKRFKSRPVEELALLDDPRRASEVRLYRG
jgi:KDO2-lipid IV(A) lauroyltransferase